VVIVEAVIFHCDQRLHRARGDLFQRYPLAVDALVLGQHNAVGGHYDRGRRGFGLAQIADAGRERNEHQHIQQHQRRQQQRRPDRMPPGGGCEAANLLERKRSRALDGLVHARKMQFMIIKVSVSNTSTTNRTAGAFRLCVAPMMDWTDRHCRYFLRQISPTAFLYTEMITTGALLHGDRDRHLAFSPASILSPCSSAAASLTISPRARDSQRNTATTK
jgi:hypothetical protein